MNKYDKGLESSKGKNEEGWNGLDFSVLKYFWQSNPLRKGNIGTIPRFLRDLEIFKRFSENELRILSKYIHVRSFQSQELIFNQGDAGVGFYLIFSGHVQIFYRDTLDDISNKDLKELDLVKPYHERNIALLEKYDYFGELALLQDNGLRTACAVAKDSTVLLGFFKPDIESMIARHPIIAAKLLQSISIIVSNRFSSVTKEIKILKYKLKDYEDSSNIRE
jgi:CRP/FNR family cyclic AMP-dependent transcriptional regulator